MTTESTESKETRGSDVTSDSASPSEETCDNSETTEARASEKVSDSDTALADAQDKYIRLAAEFENFKKRNARERLDLINSANDRILLQMIDTVDNFERALESAEKGQNDDNPQKLYQALHEGAKMIHQQLVNILKSHGVEAIETEGKPFDPTYHEAVIQIETDEQPEDQVAQVVSKGYKRGDRVLRHSQVGVSAKKKTKE